MAVKFKPLKDRVLVESAKAEEKTADFLEKGSWAMMIALFVLCIVSASFLPNSGIQEEEQDTNAPAATQATE